MQNVNEQYAEMRLLAYQSVPLSVLCVFWKFEVRERLGLKIGGGGTAFPCVLCTLAIDNVVLKRRLQTNTAIPHIYTVYIDNPSPRRTASVYLAFIQQYMIGLYIELLMANQ